MTTTARSDTWLISASIDGGTSYVWDDMTGGDNDSTTQIIRQGGMALPKVIGGQQTVSNLTLKKTLELETDWAMLVNLMKASVGSSVVTVTRQPLDYDANPFGIPLVYTGILKQIIPGDTDAQKADPLFWSLVMVPQLPIG